MKWWQERNLPFDNEASEEPLPRWAEDMVYVGLVNRIKELEAQLEQANREIDSLREPCGCLQ
jgi:hypothetical protein